MNALIKIEAREISGASTQTCNARDLWAFVESKQQFADWIKSRIEKYGFVEGEDFTVHKFMTQYNQVDRIDYHLTLDTAKEVAMVESNEKGRQVRRYFIECERQAMETFAKAAQEAALERFNVPQTYPDAMRLAADLAEQKAHVEAKLALAAPKAEALDRIADADGTMNPTVAAKALQVQPKRLFDFLREHHWIYRRPGGNGNVAYQDKIQAGYLTHKVTTVQREDGTEKVVEQVLVTGKGLAKLSQALGMH